MIAFLECVYYAIICWTPFDDLSNRLTEMILICYIKIYHYCSTVFGLRRLGQNTNMLQPFHHILYIVLYGLSSATHTMCCSIQNTYYLAFILKVIRTPVLCVCVFSCLLRRSSQSVAGGRMTANGSG